MDATTLGLVGGVLVLLGRRTLIVRILRRRTDSTIDPAILETFRQRIRAWWILCAVLAASILMHQTVTIVLFGASGLLGLARVHHPDPHPARRPPHAVLRLLRVVAAAVPAGGDGGYGLFSIVIPVYAFLFVPAGIAISGDSKRFLERTAKIQSGLLICVYCLSYAPPC